MAVAVLMALAFALTACSALPPRDSGPTTGPAETRSPERAPTGITDAVSAIATPAAAPTVSPLPAVVPTSAPGGNTPAASPTAAATAMPSLPVEPLSVHLLTAIESPHPARFFSLSPDGALLAYTTATLEGEFEGVIVITDATTGKELRRIVPNGTGDQRAFPVHFGADGARLAAVHADDKVRIWDAATGAEVAQVNVGWIDEYNPNYYRATLSPDGARLLFSGGDSLQIWDVASGTMLREITSTAQSTYDSGWSADGRFIYALKGSNAPEGQVAVYDAATGASQGGLAEAIADPGYGLSEQSAALSRDGARVMVAGPYVTRVVDRSTGRRLFHVVGEAAALAPSSDWLVTRDDFGGLHLWDARNGEWLSDIGNAPAPLGCHCLDISADGRRIAAFFRGEEKDSILIWEVRGQVAPRPAIPSATPVQALKLAEAPSEMLKLTETPAGERRIYHAAAISRDGQRAVWNSGGQVLVWDTTTGRLTYRGQLAPKPAYHPRYTDAPGKAFPDPAAELLVSNLQDRLDTAARIWQAGASQSRWTFPAQETPLTYERMPYAAWWTWSGDGRRVARPDSAHGVAIWEPESGAVIRLQLPEGEIVRLALSARGDRMVVAFHEGRLLAYDVGSKRQLWTATFPEYSLRSFGMLSFSPDDRRLVVATEDTDRTLRVFEAVTGNELARTSGLAFAPSHIAWRGDSRYFITGGQELIATVWDAETARAVRRLPGHDEAISGVAFSADGKHAVTLTASFTVRRWDVSDLK